MPSLRQHINMFFYGRKIPRTITPLSAYVTMIENRTAFSFARYGDGEWEAILGKPGKNCDGHEYFPAMSDQLREAVIHPSGDYMFAIQRYAIRQMGHRIWHFIRTNNVRLQWHHSDVFHHANAAGKLFPLIKALRSRRVVMVGPDYLRALDVKLVDRAAFIEVPRVNCFMENGRIEREITDDARAHEATVYLITASMAANCIIHHLYPAIGSIHTLIDIGSLWDAYVGVNSRGFCTRFDWTENFRKNTGGID